MDPARWQQLQNAFAAVVECPAGDRAGLMARICGEDAELGTELESLLMQWAQDPDYLEQGLLPHALPALEIPADELLGQTVGAWRIQRRIGHGGMGSVYLAERIGDGFDQLAAIKVIARGMDSEQVLARFRAERQILAGLEHPNIARVIDGGMTAGGAPWFAMSYLEGAQPLDQYCDDRRLTIAQRLHLMITVCGAVQFAHQNLVVHRDLKPANILVTAHGQPVLLDFGIAKLLDQRDAAQTQQAVPVLTPQYASPEQALGRPITTASDVYQLGILLYEQLCGARPYDTVDQLRSTHGVRRPSVRIDASCATLRHCTAPALRRMLRGDLDTICLRALDPDPQRRYRSAEALADDLSRHLHGLPVQAQLDTFTYRAGKFLRRNRWSSALAATLFVSAIGFGLFSTITAARISDQARALRDERDRAQAIANFLTNLFTQADPTKSQLDITADEMLERGAAQLEYATDLRDTERAAVLTAIGGVYQVRGSYERSRQALDQAVAIGRDGGMAPESFATTLLELAKLEYRQDDFAASEQQAREALEILDGVPDANAESRASALHQLSLALGDLHRPQEAAELLEAAIAIRRDSPGAETDQNLAADLNNLGLLYLDLGRLDVAEAPLNESLAIVERRYGPDHVYGAFLRNSRAGLYRRQGHHERARRDLEEALRIALESLGPEHPFVAHVQAQLQTAAEAGPATPQVAESPTRPSAP